MGAHGPPLCTMRRWTPDTKRTFFFTCCWHREKQQGDYAAVVLRLEFLRLMVMSRTDTVDVAQSDVLVRCGLIFFLVRNRCIAPAGLSSCVCAFANRSSKCVCQRDADVSSLVCLHLLSRTLQNARSKYPPVQQRLKGQNSADTCIPSEFTLKERVFFNKGIFCPLFWFILLFSTSICLMQRTTGICFKLSPLEICHTCWETSHYLSWVFT